MLPISSAEETKGMKIKFFIYAWIFFFVRIAEKSDKKKESALQYKIFLVVHWPPQWCSFYYKRRHFEFVPRRTQSDCSKKCGDKIDKCKIFGAKTAEVTSDWKKIT